MTPEKRQQIRALVRNIYDLQKLRIQSGNRAGPQAEHAEAVLEADHKSFEGRTSTALHSIEADGFRELGRQLKGVPIFDQWLSLQKGVGPAMAGVLLSEIDIEKADTASKIWAYCGLTPTSKRVKGQKTNYNPWLKSKVTSVLGGSFLKCNSPWRKFYDDYKNRKQNQLVDVCCACEGTGKFKMSASANRAQLVDALGKRTRWISSQTGALGDVADPGTSTDVVGSAGRLVEGVTWILKDFDGTKVTAHAKGSGIVVVFDVDAFRTAFKPSGACPNCNGTGGPAPWGRSDAHRHTAAIRYMVKMFIVEFHKQYRTIQGLPVRPSYMEEYLGRQHHGNAAE